MKKILVVEDEYYARKSIVKILQESDLDIQVCGEAANGMKAIELLEEYKDIALVITDIQMQKMGGLELASYLHKHIPEIDVLILTAFENFDYAREALRYNVKDYIVKPIYKENLLPPVKKVLEKQEEKSRNQEKIKNYYQWEAAKNYFPVKTIVAHEELYHLWNNYRVTAVLKPVTGTEHFVNIRVQGAMRSYAAGFSKNNKLVLRKNYYGYTTLCETDFEWKVDEEYKISLTADGSTISVSVNDKEYLKFTDSDLPLLTGCAGISVEKGSHCLYRDIAITGRE